MIFAVSKDFFTFIKEWSTLLEIVSLVFLGAASGYSTCCHGLQVIRQSDFVDFYIVATNALLNLKNI